MKINCVYKNYDQQNITVGKSYNVLSVVGSSQGQMYKIENDLGDVGFYTIDQFVVSKL